MGTAQIIKVNNKHNISKVKLSIDIEERNKIINSLLHGKWNDWLISKRFNIWREPKGRDNKYKSIRIVVWQTSGFMVYTKVSRRNVCLVVPKGRIYDKKLYNTFVNRNNYFINECLIPILVENEIKVL